MIYVVSSRDAGRYVALFDQVYRLRHKVFAEELGRSDLAQGLERDQSERPDMVHHICMRGGEAVGCLCVLPTVGPHVSSCGSSRLSHTRFPRGLDTYEQTRYCVAREHRTERTGAGAELVTGLVEWGLACRVNKIIAEMDTAWLLRAMQLKFKVNALHAQAKGGKDRVATLIEFDASVLEALRAYRKHKDPVVSFLGEHKDRRLAMPV